MRPPADNINRIIAPALEAAIRDAAHSADDPGAFLDSLDVEFARALTADLSTGGDKVSQMRLRAALAVAFAEARAKVRQEFEPK
jgi:hypothetical protein